MSEAGFDEPPAREPIEETIVKIVVLYDNALHPGGYPRDCRWLCGALAAAGHEVMLIAPPGHNHDGLGATQVLPPAEFVRLRVDADVVHVWGLMIPRQLKLARRVVRSIRPRATVVSPLAHLMPAHLQRKRAKKAVYLGTVLPTLRRAGLAAHYFSPAEAESAGPRLRPVASFQATVGVFPPPAVAPGTRPSHPYLLFMGRNDVEQKGLDLLARAYRAAVGRGLRMPLVVAGQPSGPSEQFWGRQLDDEILRHLVVVRGAVSEEDKWALLRGARALVFLSRWDGPPRPVREAVAAGTPVIVSTGTNMGHLVRATGAGLWVESGDDAIGALLQAGGDKPPEDWLNGVRALREQLTWDRVAQQYEEGYSSVVKASPDTA